MVTRISSQVTGGTRLKTPALYADAGEIHETAKKLLLGTGDRKSLIDKVGILVRFWCVHTNTPYFSGNRLAIARNWYNTIR